MKKVIVVCLIMLAIAGAALFGFKAGFKLVNMFTGKQSTKIQEENTPKTSDNDIENFFEKEIDAWKNIDDGKNLDESKNIFDKNTHFDKDVPPDQNDVSEDKKETTDNSDVSDENVADEPSGIVDGIKQVNKKVYVTAKIGLNVRTGNSTDYKIITAVPRGTELSVIGICENNWLLIDYNGQHLYVCGKYTRDAEATSDNATEYANGDIREETGDVNTLSPTHWNYARKGLKIDINKHEENSLVYWVADIYTEDPENDINTAFAGGSYASSLNTKKKTSTLASANGAMFAVNGDACGFRGVGSAYQNPCLIRNGHGEYELIKDKNIGEMCGLAKNGELVIFNPINYSSNQELLNMGITDTWWFDCALVKEGQVPQSLLNAESHLSKAPYTAIGQKDNNNFIFIVVDGRGSNGSVGVTYTGMAKLMQRYGAYTAYQLDGGGSSTIWFDGTVLNKPSDGNERAISDIIYIKR